MAGLVPAMTRERAARRQTILPSVVILVPMGLGPATHVFSFTRKVVGARAKPGHDTERSQSRSKQHWHVTAGVYPDAYAVKPSHDGVRALYRDGAEPSVRRPLPVSFR